MEKSFATHSHSVSIRSVSNSKYYLASAGADETVCLYDMRYRRGCGKLIHHNDTINCIAFTPENSHLFTCSNDGSIAAIRCGNWQTKKHWPKAHKGSAVNTLAIHPTGKLALSTGTDGVLRTWNLIKGRIEKEIKFDSKVICAEFLKDNLIAVGLENEQIKFCDLKAAQIMDTTAHDMRVKCIAHTNDLLVSASSSGEIKLWRYKHGLNILQTVNCGARITCLSLAQACRNLTQETEVKLEEENEVRKESKLRLKQQVIVDYADDWEV
ncbi:p21-activated protein kinase-interacting protein 1-like protein [Ooceraea biroi]|uniref:p21-activated protein kinase-interacting protein 1-like protein n=1 Tax=Ooceraea biroi TaxID=2015173 RepID=A0A026X0R0_OOCBI|nr:p21-activated protein kinase-interacting protein 1-like protein [Ooceraea biroi]